MRLSSFLTFFLLFITAASAQVIGVDRASHFAAAVAPVVTNTIVNLSVPVTSLNVLSGSAYVSNSPTGCTITAGNTAGNYAIASDCTITVTTPTGVNNLTTFGTDVLTVQATNAAAQPGTGQVTINKWPDGSTAAACSTPQYSGVLTQFGGRRTPWKVAGVDYCVGPADGTVFKDPATIQTALGSAVTFPCAGDNTRICVNTAGTIIDGWDFTLGATGYWLDINADNVTVRNSKFRVSGKTQLLRIENTSHTFTFTYNTVDGNGISGTLPLVGGQCGNTAITYQYNWVHNGPNDLFNFCSGTLIVRFNALEDAGLSTTTGNFISETGLTGNSITLQASFNFARQRSRSVSGFGFTPNPGSFVGINCDDYNTIIADGSTVVLNDGVGPKSNTGFITNGGTFQAQNNYAAYINSATGTFLHCGTATFTSYVNNVNMVNGAQFTSAACAPPPVPVVTASTYNLALPVNPGDPVGVLITSDAPTSYDITACSPNCTNFFSIAAEGLNNQGQIRVGSAGTQIQPRSTYTVAMRAFNASGPSTAVNQTIVTGDLLPTMIAGNFNISFPVHDNDPIGTVSALNGPQSFTIVPGTCSPAPCSAFNTPTSNGTWTIATGGTFQASTNYTVQMTATNSRGTSNPAIQQVNVGAATTGTPVITPETFTISTPAGVGDLVGHVTASNNPTSYNRVNCTPACSVDWFAINNSNGNITVTAAGATGMPGTATKQTVTLTLSAANANGTGPSANETINGYADGFKGAPNCSTATTAFTGPAAGTLIATVSGQGYPPAPFQALARSDGGVVAQGGSPTTFGVVSAGGSQILIQRIVNPGQYTTAPPNPTTISIVSDPTIPSGFNAQKATVSLTYTQTSTTVANIQFPTLLDSYGTNRPPWKVAGVDYCVGPPSNIVFKTPGVDPAPSCVSIAGHTFNISTPNCVIDGWNFTANGGWNIAADCGSTNITITNNKFVTVSGDPDIIVLGFFNCSPNTINATVKNNIINPNSVRTGGDAVADFRGGPIGVFQYNIIENTWCDSMKANANNDTGNPLTNYDIRYNVFFNPIRHDATEDCHGDVIQTGDGGVNGDIRLQFNVLYVNGFACGDPATCGGQGWVMNGNNHGATFNNEFLDFNTIVLQNFNFEQMNSCMIFAPNFVSGQTTVTNNYVDANPATHCLWNQGTGPGALTYSGNINMRTGGTCAQSARC